MSLLLIMPDCHMEDFKAQLLEQDPDAEIEIWPEVKHPEKVVFAVSWNHPSRALQAFPNLRCISSFGAGVDHFKNDAFFPPNLEVCRIVCRSLASDMADYLLGAVLNYSRNMREYLRLEGEGKWAPLSYRSRPHVGLLGLGELGVVAGERFASMGFPVSGWSRSQKHHESIQCFSGMDGLDELLMEVDVLICLLPLTAETEGILCKALFQKVKPGCYLINVGRGGHLVEEHLRPALDAGWLAGACLDVFQQEPLPRDHVFWGDPRITITPHVAAETNPRAVAQQIMENYRRCLRHEPLKFTVDLREGY